ncbi:MAG: cation:proton antiporter [Armatimonadota bacterium]|jgi:Kef-type K+ transport system membrane component KefB/Trk K+ transport system NAD-binding subunit
MESLFFEFATVLMVAAVAGAIGTLLKQPLIISFIVVGFFIGPSVLGVVNPDAEMELLADMVQLLGDAGIALLLFSVGLTLDLSNVRTMGLVALAAGIGQMTFTILFGFLLAQSLGMSGMAAVYVAVALAMSSAVIPMKILADRGEVESLHGRVAIGALIVQDVGVIGAIVGLAAVGAVGQGDASVQVQLVRVVLNAALLIAASMLLARFVLPHVVGFLRRSGELLLLFAVAWAMAFAVLAEGAGLSRELGAFLAGIALAPRPYREAFAAPLARLRDFLLLFFFVYLGAALDPAILRAQVSHAAAFAAFVLIGNTGIVMVIMGLMGYRSRTSFFTGTALAQTSVFSLVVANMGVALGHIALETLGLITLVAIVTIAVCTYVLTYSGGIYERLRRALQVFERKVPFREASVESVPESEEVDVVIMGMGRLGGEIAHSLQLRQRNVLGVDFDPEVLSRARRRGLPAAYGDVDDPEMLHHLPLEQAAVIVCAVPGLKTNLMALRTLRQYGYSGRIAVTAHTEDEAATLRDAGADLVLQVFAYAAEHAAEAVTAAMHHLPEHPDLPLSVAEVRLPPGSVLCGERLETVRVREETGATVMAISRAGRVYFDPDPNLRLFPGDHLVLIGASEDLLRAREYLEQQEFEGQPDYEFIIDEIELAEDSPLVGRSLAEMDFRNQVGATVVVIEREEGEFARPDPHEPLRAGDRLYVAGRRSAVEELPS